MAKKINKPINEVDEPTLKPIAVSGIVKVLRANVYKNHKIIIRQIYEEYFEYVLEFDKEIYSSFIIIKPREGESKLTDQEVQEASALIYNGAMTTVDTLLGDVVDEDTKRKVELFESKREVVEKAMKGE